MMCNVKTEVISVRVMCSKETDDAMLNAVHGISDPFPESAVRIHQRWARRYSFSDIPYTARAPSDPSMQEKETRLKGS